MPTYDDMNRGLANPHDMARRKAGIKGRVDVKKMGHTQLMRKLNAEPDGNGTVSFGSLQRAWKIMGKALGENTNTEHLRKVHYGGTYRNERSIEQCISESS